jgi:predicted MFS family arabinose efflux permease
VPALVALRGHLSACLSRIGRALHVPRYRILWLGTLFSFLAMQMQIIARGYLAYDLTGSNTALGGVMIAFGVPQLLLALWGGVVADRMAKRNVLMLWTAAVAAGSAALSVAIAAGAVQYWMLLAMAVLTGTAFAFIAPARQAFIGDLLPDELMGNATALQQASMNGTRVVGPALAGVLIATPLIGMAGVYALTTLAFLAAAGTLFLLPAGRPKRDVECSSPVEDMVDSLRYVRQDRPVGLLLLMSFTVVAFAFPYIGFLPSVVRGLYGKGAFALGVLSSVSAAGALLATLAAAGLTGHRRVWYLQAGAGAAFALSLSAFALAPSFVVALAIVFFLGAFGGGFQALNNALTMTLADQSYYGRIQAMVGLNWSLYGILSLPLGAIADLVGLRTTLALMAALALVSVVALQALARREDVPFEVRRRTGHLRREPWEPGVPEEVCEALPDAGALRGQPPQPGATGAAALRSIARNR